MTQLQKALSKSKLRRNLAAAFMISEKIPLHGFKRLVNGVFSECIESMPDPDIKRLLYMILLQCSDATEEQRQEAFKLLQLSDTALTGVQQQAMKHSLTG